MNPDFSTFDRDVVNDVVESATALLRGRIGVDGTVILDEPFFASVAAIALASAKRRVPNDSFDVVARFDSTPGCMPVDRDLVLEFSRGVAPLPPATSAVERRTARVPRFMRMVFAAVAGAEPAGTRGDPLRADVRSPAPRSLARRPVDRQHDRHIDSEVTLTNEVTRILNSWNARWPNGTLVPYFRGVDDAGHACEPGLLRAEFETADPWHTEYQIKLQFRLRGNPLLAAPLQPGWHELFVMQHSSFPTRLLDWTESLPVGLYFAVRERSADHDGVIWMMAPNHLMDVVDAPGRAHFAAGDVTIGRYLADQPPQDRRAFDALPPIPVFPHYVSPRILAQHGRFTMHTFRAGALADLAADDRNRHGEACFLQRLVVPAGARRHMLGLAHLLGATEASLFPDVDGLARQVRMSDFNRLRE